MLRTLDKSHDNIIGFSASGEISDADYEQAISRLKDGIAEHGTIRTVFRVEDVSPKSFISGLDDRMSFTTDHKDDVERVAIVSDSTMASAMSAIGGFVSDIEMKTFDMSDEEQAWAWVE